VKPDKIEQLARDLAATMPSVPPSDWPLIVKQAMAIHEEIAKLQELPLMDVEPIFCELPRR
jgi:hypothetical protein